MDIFAQLRKEPDLYYPFLLQLDDDKLNTVCQLDKTIRSYCNSNHLWKLKIEQIYPDIPIPITYKDNLKIFYYFLKYLSLNDLVKLATDIDDIQLLDWIWQQNSGYKNEEANFYFIRSMGNLPATEYFNLNIGKGHSDLEEWALEHDILLNYTSIANAAAYYSNFELLNELAKQEIYPDDRAWEAAVVEGHLDTIKWLYNHKIDPRIEYEEMLYALASGNFSDAIKWFITELKIEPTIDLVNLIAAYGTPDMLQWLADKKRLYPDFEGYIMAITHFNHENVKWIDENDDFSSDKIPEPDP